MDCTFCNIRDFFEKGSYYKLLLSDKNRDLINAVV